MISKIDIEIYEELFQVKTIWAILPLTGYTHQ